VVVQACRLRSKAVTKKKKITFMLTVLINTFTTLKCPVSNLGRKCCLGENLISI
jgi:hypothetical protein